MIKQQFTEPLLAWYQQFGRKDLPWQHPRSPYYVWLSEIMLQQTQVKTVIPYFHKFVQRFPDLSALANAPLDDVLTLWAGLGYYSRARNLHRCANELVNHHQGQFPTCSKQLETLPGIGPSTAAAIASLAFNLPSAILDGNVKRVLCRFFAIHENPEKPSVKQALWHKAQECMDEQHCADYTQAIMDLGATCCTRSNPNCQSCPVKRHCQAFKHDLVAKLPIRVTRKSKPTRTRYFYLLSDSQNRIYFKRNPNEGIWGGLWCLPNVSDDSDSQDWLKNKGLSQPNGKQTPLIKMKHTFTHFHLNLEVFHQLISTSEPRLLDDGKWISQEQIRGYGLPKPMNDIISAFWQSK